MASARWPLARIAGEEWKSARSVKNQWSVASPQPLT
jgi:hypothetical protein